MTHCPITGVNLKRFLLTLILGFAFIFGYSFLVHAHLLVDIYEQTPDLWRTEEDFQNYCTFSMLNYFALVLVTALIFTRNYEGKGIKEGLRFGALLGLLFGVQMSSGYGWMPISSFLAGAWFVTGLLEGLGLGIIYSLTYKK